MNPRDLLNEVGALLTDPDLYSHPGACLAELGRVLTGQVHADTVAPLPVGLILGHKRRDFEILSIARGAGGRVSQAHLRAFFPNLSSESLRLCLARLCREGRLVKIGDKKGAYYVEAPERNAGTKAARGGVP